MSDEPAHVWSVGDEVWARYYDVKIDNYVAQLEGKVTHVGPKGFTMRRARPDHKGRLIDHKPHDIGMWPTKADADAHIAAHPFSSEPPNREKKT